MPRFLSSNSSDVALTSPTTFIRFRNAGDFTPWAFGAWIRTTVATQEIVNIQDADQTTLLKISLNDNKVGLFVKGMESTSPYFSFPDFEKEGLDASNICDGNWHYVGLVWMCTVVSLFQFTWSAFVVKDGKVVDTLSDSLHAPEPLPSFDNATGGAAAGGSQFNLTFNGGITYVLLSRCPSFTDPGTVTSWFEPYQTTIPGKTRFANDADLFLPFFTYFAAPPPEQTPPAEWKNMVNDQPVTLTGAATVEYDDTYKQGDNVDKVFFLDGFSELVGYSPIEPFIDFINNEPNAFSWIIKKAGSTYAAWDAKTLRNEYTNLADTLDAVFIAFETVKYEDGQGFNQDEFNHVQSTIQDELTAVMNVRSYFITCGVTWKEVMLDGLLGCLDLCQNDFGSLTPAKDSIDINIQELFGVIFEALAAAGGEECEVAMQIYNAFWSVANLIIDAEDGTPKDTDAYMVFQAAFNELHAQLEQNFTSTINNTAATVQSLLGDYGKLKAANLLTTAGKLDLEVSDFQFPDAAQLAARLEFTRRLMIATFYCYSTNNYLAPCPDPYVEISAKIPAGFVASGKGEFPSYWARAIGTGSDDNITVAPTKQLADLIFTQGEVTDFWSWGFRTIDCPWTMPPS